MKIEKQTSLLLRLQQIIFEFGRISLINPIHLKFAVSLSVVIGDLFDTLFNFSIYSLPILLKSFSLSLFKFSAISSGLFLYKYFFTKSGNMFSSSPP